MLINVLLVITNTQEWRHATINANADGVPTAKTHMIGQCHVSCHRYVRCTQAQLGVQRIVWWAAGDVLHHAGTGPMLGEPYAE